MKVKTKKEGKNEKKKEKSGNVTKASTLLFIAWPSEGQDSAIPSL